ncbi:MAG: hypothetical protein H8M99_08175 [Gloeobacteraceae cyanobacterium ES-bin-144]|nr:hypothetical protein [Verrucomicrobiales bacterium]
MAHLAAKWRMGGRKVVPEILDHLPPEDPEARRSRRDLRRINFLMGNERWVCRAIRKFSDAALRGIVELGAGDGMLVAKLAHSFPAAPVTGCDLVPRPDRLASRVIWKQGDLLSADCEMSGGILISNLFLHHFEGASLRQLGQLCNGFEILVFNEPDRSTLPHLLGGSMWPMINRVTRHDMHVSISAGFARDEMPSLMGIDPAMWSIVETCTWRGARRVLGCRR